MSTRPMNDEPCANCGQPGATIPRPYRDQCPTDRGVEVREGTEYICEQCQGQIPGECALGRT